jgi:heterodisulfide reductase subunit A
MMGNIGVYICECGPNIKDRIDIDEVIGNLGSEKNVKVIKRYPLLCSNDGKTFLEEEIKKEGITHLVVGACSPKEHEHTFMGVCERAGINPYLLQMINIREQCAWMISDKEEATRKAVKAIRAGINRVILQAALETKEIEVFPDVLVIGGGVSGLEAALTLAGEDRKVHLVEKESGLGGMAKHFHRLLPCQGENPELIADLITRVSGHPYIDVHTSSQVVDIKGFLGNFRATISSGDNQANNRDIGVGAIIVATGFQLSDVKDHPRFSQAADDNILSALDFEAMMNTDKVTCKNGQAPGSVALIHCAGREERGYCSKVCCLYLLRYAQYLREKLPETEVLEFYSELCLPHKDDQAFFDEAKAKGVRFIRTENDVELSSRTGRIEVAYTSSGKRKTESVDMAVLAPAIIPSDSCRDLASMLNIPLDETGFFKEIHEILNPVATPAEGVYIAGCASGPKNIPESIIQAEAASGKIFASLIPGRTIKTEAKVAEVRQEFCTGCQTCLTVCFYGAISYDKTRGVSEVNEAICRGCGSCVGSCPSGAIRAKHFTDYQIYREILEALR